MEHLQKVREEFTRQAERFASAPAVTEDELTERFVQAAGPDPGGVLDVACGPGIVSAALAPRAREVVGLDVTPEMLSKARQRCEAAGLRNVSFREGSATDLPFAEDAFDTVVTRLAIHHFSEPRQVLGEISRVLRPGGRLVLADIVSSENPEESALHNALEVLRDPSHVRMLPASELRALVGEAGLTIEAEFDLGSAARVRGMGCHRRRPGTHRAAPPDRPRPGRGRTARRHRLIAGRWHCRVRPPLVAAPGSAVERAHSDWKFLLALPSLTGNQLLSATPAGSRPYPWAGTAGRPEWSRSPDGRPSVRSTARAISRGTRACRAPRAHPGGSSPCRRGHPRSAPCTSRPPPLARSRVAAEAALSPTPRPRGRRDRRPRGRWRNTARVNPATAGRIMRTPVAGPSITDNRSQLVAARPREFHGSGCPAHDQPAEFIELSTDTRQADIRWRGVAGALCKPGHKVAGFAR